MKLAVVAIVFLMGVSARAQDAPDAPSQDQGQTAPQPQPYGGPAILSRGDDPSVLRGLDLPPLRPYLGATGIYRSNSEGFYGNPGAPPAYGLGAMFGVTGSHSWSHSELYIDYHGSYYDYVPHQFENGFDNSLNLTFTHQLSPHLSITLTENVSRVRNFSALPIGTLYGGGMSGVNPLYNALSGVDLNSSPSLADVSGVRMTYQATARLSFSAGGSGIVSRQEFSGGTVGANGYVASGDVAYRLTRYQTISGGYSYTHFDYTGRYGETDIHGFDVSYSLRLGRFWEVAASAGLSRAEITGEVLDPILAQFLGVPSILVRTYRVSYMPTGTARLTRSFRRSSWWVDYSHMVLGGAGAYTAATNDTVGSTYSYWGLRRLSLNAGGGYYRFSSLNQALGSYKAYGLSGGFGVPMGMGFSWVGRIDWRHYSLGNAQDQSGYNASLGIGWRPGRVPVSLW